MGVEVIPKITFEEFRKFPVDGKRYELVRGEVHVTPSPATRHQAIVQNLSGNLWPFVIKNRLGEVWTAPLDVRLSEDTAFQPDLIFVSNARAGIILENWIEGAPDLVVEVSLPSTATYDRATKLPVYAESGVSEYWLIDSQDKTPSTTDRDRCRRCYPRAADALPERSVPRGDDGRFSTVATTRRAVAIGPIE